MTSKKQSGFSLIELMVTMGFSLALIASIYGVFRAQTHTTKGQESRMEAHEYAMSVLDTMVREIRNTGYFPNNGTPCTSPANTGGIVSATADSFSLVYETDMTTATCDRTVTFTYDGANKNILRDGASLTDGNVTAVSFTFYPQQTSTTAPAPYCVSGGTPTGCSGTLSTNFANVQKVAISVTVQAKSNDTQYGGQSTITMSSTADLRNHGIPS
jgi:prepilin-type N-terminal cleavage/methylation domain-containing protein